MSNELNGVLAVLGSPIRRRIIQRLSQESSYPLKLSGDLGLNQQLVTKHLRVMEEARVVEAETESSPYGPARRMYNIVKSISLTIDFSPDLYSEHMLSFEDAPLSSKSAATVELKDRLDSLSTRTPEVIDSFVDLIAEIDRRIDELNVERAELLCIRRMAMRAAKENIRGKDASLKERMVAYHILNRNARNVNRISKGLDERKDTIARVLDRLRDKSILR